MIPRWFEYMLLAQYAILCLWHVYRKEYWKAWYWFGALDITAAAIFGIKGK